MYVMELFGPRQLSYRLSNSVVLEAPLGASIVQYYPKQKLVYVLFKY